MWYLVHQAETVQCEGLQLWTSSIFHIRQEKGESWMPESSLSLREARGGHGSALGDKSCFCLQEHVRGPEGTPVSSRTQCPGLAR